MVEFDYFYCQGFVYFCKLIVFFMDVFDWCESFQAVWYLNNSVLVVVVNNCFFVVRVYWEYIFESILWVFFQLFVAE